MKKQEKVAVLVRVPREVRSWIEARASVEHSTIQSVVETAIRDKIVAEVGDDKPKSL
jgi:hypothetical protein